MAGFASGYAIAESKCAKSTANFTLRTVSSVLLGKEENLDSAADRARLAYQVGTLVDQCCESYTSTVALTILTEIEFLRFLRLISFFKHCHFL